MTAARIYARFSTERQSETSIADQVRICREFAAANGWPVESEHADEGISGAALGNRPGALDALEAARAGDCILVADLSRLSRSQDLAPLLSRLAHRGVRVVGVQDGFDSESRTARMQAGLSGIMSEEFRAMIADRTRSALQSRAQAGKPTGGKAYDNPEIVREIFERFADGETMKAIANDLNRRGIPSPGADWKRRSNPRGRWVVSALHSLLKNERYIGRVVWNKSRWVKDPDSGKRKRIPRPESEWIVNECEPVVDGDTWRRAQARFQIRGGRGGRRRYLLSGILECAECGSKMVVYGGSQHRYICGAYHNGGRHACSNTATFPRALAEERILAHVEAEMLSPAAIAVGVKRLREERTKVERRSSSQVDREIRELERLVREGLISAETAAPALREARKRAQDAGGADGSAALPWPSEKAWRALVADMREILQGEDVAEAREALRALLGSIRCRPEDDHVVAEWDERRELLMTGTGSVDGMVAGARYSVHLPISTRKEPGGIFLSP